MAKKLTTSDASTHTKATMIQMYFDASLNEELDLLVTDVVDMEVDASAKEIEGPRSRGDLRGVVSATVAACRKKFMTLLREHKRDIE